MAELAHSALHFPSYLAGAHGEHIHVHTGSVMRSFPVQVKLQSSRLSLSWTREGVFDHEVIHVFLRLVQDHREAKVMSVAEKPRTKAPPHALHTVELLRMASAKLHIGPKQTMVWVCGCMGGW